MPCRPSDSFFVVCLPTHFFSLASDSFFWCCQSGRMIVVSIYDMSILRIQMGTKGREAEGVS